MLELIVHAVGNVALDMLQDYLLPSRVKASDTSVFEFKHSTEALALRALSEVPAPSCTLAVDPTYHTSP